MVRKRFSIIQDNLQNAIDVDASDGRSVPINMNFVDEGFLTKDTGFIPYGSTESQKCHSMFYYKKKNGTSYQIRANGTKLQSYNEFERAWADIIGSPTFTEDAEFGYITYDDDLYFGNAVESLYKWDGTTFTEYASAPKGNVLEIFEDRLFVSGVTTEPLSVYYSNVGVPTTFTPADIVAPLGTDSVTNLRNYYGSLLIFKQDSIWKLTFVYDQVATLFVPKIESQSGTYGACSKRATAWVENDIWFFTGREVRAIGYADNVSGVFGINKSVISEPIEETLDLVDSDNFDQVVCFYNNRRFYLAVPLTADTNDVLFVCHTLYGNLWTKYSGRSKARVNGFMVIDENVFTTTSSAAYATIKWNVVAADALPLNNSLGTES